MRSLSDDIKELNNVIEKAFYMAYEAPELNMSNYNSDDVEKLNNAMIDVYDLLGKAVDLSRLIKE